MKSMPKIPSLLNPFLPRKNCPRYLEPKVLFTFLIGLVVAANVTALSWKLTHASRHQRIAAFYFSGNKFSGLEEIFKNEEYVGYYTDKNLDNNHNAAQFAQAQYVLAPIVLDFNNTGHTFTLFDCSDEQKAFKKIKEIGAVALKKNKYGIILAAKRR